MFSFVGNLQPSVGILSEIWSVCKKFSTFCPDDKFFSARRRSGEWRCRGDVGWQLIPSLTRRRHRLKTSVRPSLASSGINVTQLMSAGPTSGVWLRQVIEW